MSRQDTQLFPEEIPAGAGAARLRQVLFEKERRDRAESGAQATGRATPRVRRLAASA